MTRHPEAPQQTSPPPELIAGAVGEALDDARARPGEVDALDLLNFLS